MLTRDPECKRCPLHRTAEFVCLLGDGPVPYDVMIIGEAPGHREDTSGVPFVGESGRLLRQALTQAGIYEAFITNAVSCRPPLNRTPTKSEIKACRHWLEYQCTQVKPKYVLLLGNVPLQAMTGHVGIKKLRGKPIIQNGMTLLPTFHPAYILRDPSQAPVFEADIRFFHEIITNCGVPEVTGLDYKLVNNRQLFEEMIHDLRGCVSLDIETTGLDPRAPGAAIHSVGLGTRKHQWLIDPSLLTHRALLAVLINRLSSCFVVAHNGKFDTLWLRLHYDWSCRIDFDTMLAHHLLDENSPHGLKYLAQVYCGARDYDVSIETKTGKGNQPELLQYQALDLYYTRRLRYIFGRELYRQGDVKRIFNWITMPCSRLFTDIEERGVFVNLHHMNRVERQLRRELVSAKAELDKYDPDINWRSPKQVAELLFHKLELPVVETTKTGAASTSESVMKRIDHPIARTILRYRGIAQQLSFFIDGWKPHLYANRLYPSFKLHGTVTGRLSCEHPNLQQVPRDTLIRSLITAPDGWVLVEADLSQVELRIAAELSGERNMLNAFDRGIDIHWLTVTREVSRGNQHVSLITNTAQTYAKRKVTYGEACELLLEMGHKRAIEIDNKWKEIRKKAKAINFGFLYGMGWKKFQQYARDNYGVIVTEGEAQASRNTYFNLYPDLVAWHNRQRRYAMQNGYVINLLGRKRRLPQAQSQYDTPERGEAQRQAINSPVQSFASDLNLMAALQLAREYPDDLRIVGTVHDSILMEVKRGCVRRIAPRIIEVMKHPDLLDTFDIRLRVPLTAEVTIGPWGQGMEAEQWMSANPK